MFLTAILFSLLYLTPTFLTAKGPDGKDAMPDWWPSWLPGEKIHLGLDLQGGSHLVLEVKVDKAVENHVERERANLANALKEKGVPDVSVERVEGTLIRVKATSANAERVRGILKGDFGNLVEAKTPQTSAAGTEFFLTFSK